MGDWRKTRQRRGGKQARQYAKDLRKRMTASEQALWRGLRKHGLGYKWRRQAPLWGYIADFYCPSLGLVVEVDGVSHQERENYDRRRDAHLAEHGLQTVRIAAGRVFSEYDAVLAEIKCAVVGRIFSVKGRR